MSDELLTILSGSNKDIDNQKLMDYLSNKLSEGEKHEFEKKMVDSEMLSDVVEGLKKFKNKKDVSALVDQLNTNLKKQLEKKKSRKLKRQIKDLPWLYLTIILILIIIVISFFVIKKHLDSEKPPVNLPAGKEGCISKCRKGCQPSTSSLQFKNIISKVGNL